MPRLILLSHDPRHCPYCGIKLTLENKVHFGRFLVGGTIVCACGAYLAKAQPEVMYQASYLSGGDLKCRVIDDSFQQEIAESTKSPHEPL